MIIEEDDLSRRLLVRSLCFSMFFGVLLAFQVILVIRMDAVEKRLDVKPIGLNNACTSKGGSFYKSDGSSLCIAKDEMIVILKR